MSAARLATGWIHCTALFAVLAGCAGPVKPTTMVDLTALPPDQLRRNEYLTTTEARPGPETRQPLPDRAAAVETAAATAAAILGTLFSTSSNVLVGAAAPVEENRLVDPHAEDRARLPRSDGDDEDESGDADFRSPDPSRLVPWVQIPSRASETPAPP